MSRSLSSDVDALTAAAGVVAEQPRGDDPRSESPPADGANRRDAVSIKAMLSDAAVYGLASVMDRAIGFALLPIVTLLLSPRDYGIVSLFTTTASLTFIVTSLCLHQAFFRFYTETTDDVRRRELIDTSVTLAIGFWAIAATAVWIFAEPLNRWIFDLPGRALVGALAVVALAEAIDALAGNRLQADGRPWALFWIRIGSALAVRSASVAAILVGAGAWGIISCDAAGRLATVAVITAVAFPRVRLRVSRPLVAPLASYGALLVPALLSFAAMAVTDKYTIRALVEDPLEQIGLYSVGERIAGIMQMANLAFILGWQRFAFRNMHLPDGSRIIARGFLAYAAGGAVVATGLALLGDDVTYWLIAEKFHGGMSVITPLTGAVYFSGLASAAEIGLHKARRPGSISRLNVGAALLNVALNCYAIPRWGIQGAAVATLVSQAARLAGVWRASQRAFPMPVNYGRLAIVWGTCLAIFIAGQLFRGFGWAGATVGQAALVAATPLVLWRLPMWSEAERATVRRAWRSVATRGASFGRHSAAGAGESRSKSPT
ncbi:MAG: lipopolysaccharide biosynthesis protein [Pirellulales bacterium]|nr:lipopolysaccharide biosynthesis protein [Pirellulales bacterium]